MDDDADIGPDKSGLRGGGGEAGVGGANGGSGAGGMASGRVLCRGAAGRAVLRSVQSCCRTYRWGMLASAVVGWPMGGRRGAGATEGKCGLCSGALSARTAHPRAPSVSRTFRNLQSLLPTSHRTLFLCSYVPTISPKTKPPPSPPPSSPPLFPRPHSAPPITTLNAHCLLKYKPCSAFGFFLDLRSE